MPDVSNSTTVILAIVVVIAIAALALAWVYTQRQRRVHLRERFGPEYDRTLEAVVAEREKRVASYHIHPLSAEDRGRYSESWRQVQSRFVDDPAGAVTEADMLVNEVMSARGYPMSDFDRRVEDLTVDHGDVVHHYRAAREIAGRHARRQASTEEL